MVVQDPQAPPDFYILVESRLDSIQETQTTFGMQLDNMQQQMDGFEDNVYSMSFMISAKNNFFVSQYPS